MTNSNFKVSWSNTLPGEARGSLLEARFFIRYGSLGEEVKVAGVEHGRATLTGYRTLDDGRVILTVHFKGRSYNPGSRYSGLRSYVKAETIVYESRSDGWFYVVTIID